MLCDLKPNKMVPKPAPMATDEDGQRRKRSARGTSYPSDRRGCQIPSYIATALGSHIAHKVHFKAGILAIASRTRMLGGFLLITMGIVFAMQFTRIFVFLPLLGIAALLYSIRSFIAGIGSPSVITVNIKGVHVEDYGTASSIQGLSGTISQSSIGAGGYLIEYALPMPLFVGGALQLASGFLYPKLLGRYFK